MKLVDALQHCFLRVDHAEGLSTGAKINWVMSFCLIAVKYVLSPLRADVIDLRLAEWNAIPHMNEVYLQLSIYPAFNYKVETNLKAF